MACKKCSFDLQKKSVYRLNFKTKFVDNIPKYVLRTGSLVQHIPTETKKITPVFIRPTFALYTEISFWFGS